MRKWLTYGVIFFLAYGLSLVMLWPAGALMTALNKRLPYLDVEQIHGSLLVGQAESLHFHRVALGRLSWQWQPAALIRGRFEYRFSLVSDDIVVKGVAGVDWRLQGFLKNVEGQLPFTVAVQLTGRQPPPLTGQIVFEGINLRINRNRHLLGAQGRVLLKNTHTRFGKSLTLGDFQAELQSVNDGITASVRDRGGPLQLTGMLTLSSTGSYRFIGELIDRRQNPQIRDIVRLLPGRTRNGKKQLKLSGKWNL